MRHYAAVVGVQRTLEHLKLVLDDIQGIRNILDIAKDQCEAGILCLFLRGTWQPQEHPQNEQTTPLNSRLPYVVVNVC